jgi:repressor LexA
MRTPLTEIEQELYYFLVDFLAAHTFQPSVREIGARLRIPSTKSVTDLLASLESKGYVKREPGRSRGVALVGFAGGAGTMPVPVMRPVAGRVQPASDDHLTLDRRLVPSNDAYFVSAAQEDAPAHAVRRGDLVLVHPSARARDGDVVVVRVGATVLVRAMHRRGVTVVLEAPAAGGLDRQLGPADDFTVLGVLAGVLRIPARKPAVD